MITGGTFIRSLMPLLSAACIFLFFSIPVHAAPLQPFSSPALISKPDYPNSFTAPFVEHAHPDLKTPFLLSADGYIYSVDTRGVRVYTVPLSYGLPVMPVMVPYLFVPLIPELP